MTKYAKEDGVHDKALQEVEDVLREHKIKITCISGRLVVCFEDGKRFDVVDTDGSGGFELPRSFTSERLELRENYEA